MISQIPAHSLESSNPTVQSEALPVNLLERDLDLADWPNQYRKYAFRNSNIDLHFPNKLLRQPHNIQTLLEWYDSVPDYNSGPAGFSKTHVIKVLIHLAKSVSIFWDVLVLLFDRPGSNRIQIEIARALGGLAKNSLTPNKTLFRNLYNQNDNSSCELRKILFINWRDQEILHESQLSPCDWEILLSEVQKLVEQYGMGVGCVQDLVVPILDRIAFQCSTYLDCRKFGTPTGPLGLVVLIYLISKTEDDSLLLRIMALPHDEIGGELQVVLLPYLCRWGGRIRIRPYLDRIKDPPQIARVLNLLEPWIRTRTDVREWTTKCLDFPHYQVRAVATKVLYPYRKEFPSVWEAIQTSLLDSIISGTSKNAG